jgi:starch phosphorylase
MKTDDSIDDHEGQKVLAELALNMRWSWNHATDNVWKQLNPQLWDISENPWAVLQTASRDQIESLWMDPAFRAKVDGLKEKRRIALERPAWFQQNHAQNSLSCVAYFSMEFMLSEALPIYSGGLGNVAGDQLKATSDLGVPVVGVGLLYQQGYFRQFIDKDGAQHALYPYNDPGQMPVQPVRLDNGEWLRLEIVLSGYSVWVRVWEVIVGRVKLYLLDSNDPGNFPAHRGITSELYGGGPDLRLQQEILLGVAGWRVLETLGIEPDVCHLNEGHAAFAVLERARSHMQKSGLSFEVALSVTRAGNLFTTHTAVAAGFDRFRPELIEQYLGHYAEEKLGIRRRDLLALGRLNPNDPNESFNMAYLAVRGSGAVNAVSALQEEVSRSIFHPLFPRHPLAEIPIGHVTNGVHVPTWDSAPADQLWTEACGNERWLGNPGGMKEKIEAVSDIEIWKLRTDALTSLITYTRQRLSRELAASGSTSESTELAKHIFDPEVLTLGFARRFATYKRPNLLLHDQNRLMQILSNSERPVQLIIAGKAHPEDKEGQAMIQEWIKFIQQPDARPHVAFLSDYDMTLTQHLVQGVDVWLNTPRRPWEASGTSGMKVLVNGGLNLSELDGWWAEAYQPELGWALGDGQEHGDDPAWDAAEAEALYCLLEREVIPEFYSRDSSGLPTKWVNRIRKSMSELTPLFSADRAVREYTDRFYLPAAAAYRSRADHESAIGKQIVQWRHDLDGKWSAIHIGQVSIRDLGDDNEFEAEIFLYDLDPDSVTVELYADGTFDGPAVRKEMKPTDQQGASSSILYGAGVTASRAPSDFTVRVFPRFSGVSVPLEESRILWQN